MGKRCPYQSEGYDVLFVNLHFLIALHLCQYCMTSVIVEYLSYMWIAVGLEVSLGSTI